MRSARRLNSINKCKALVVAVFALLLVSWHLSGIVRGQKNGGAALENPPDTAGLLAGKCAFCHELAISETLDKDALNIAKKEGPTLAYAGNKFRREWLEKWLTDPSGIRPAGYLSFRFVKPSPAGDQLDVNSIPSHPVLSEKEAKEVAAYLTTLKQSLPATVLKAPNPSTNTHVLFEKVLGCSACHQTEPGKGGVSAPELYTASKRLDENWEILFMENPLKWSDSSMPKSDIRPEHLASIVDYLFSLNASRSPAKEIKNQKTTASQIRLPADRAEALYKVYCSQCHGINGDGRGINAPFLFVAPRNHTSFDEMSILNDDRLSAAIKFGGGAVGKSSLMPAWRGILNDNDIQLLVNYLRKLSNTQQE